MLHRHLRNHTIGAQQALQRVPQKVENVLARLGVDVSNARTPVHFDAEIIKEITDLAIERDSPARGR